MMHHWHDHDHRPRSRERRKPARSRAMRDLAGDWQRWTRGERLSAGALMAALWLTASAVYLVRLLHG